MRPVQKDHAHFSRQSIVIPLYAKHDMLIHKFMRDCTCCYIHVHVVGWRVVATRGLTPFLASRVAIARDDSPVPELVSRPHVHVVLQRSQSMWPMLGAMVHLLACLTLVLTHRGEGVVVAR